MFLKEEDLKRLIESDRALPLRESDKTTFIQEIRNEEKWLAEDTSLTADIAPYAKILIPMYRRIRPLISGLELIGNQPMNGPIGLAFAVRYMYTNDGANVANLPSNLADKANGVDLDFRSQILVFNCTQGQYDTIVVGSTTIKAASGAGNVLGTIIYKEMVSLNGTITAKVMVNLATGETLPTAGSGMRPSTFSADVTVLAKFNNEAGYATVLKNYAGPISNANSEGRNSSYRLRGIKPIYESVQVKPETWTLEASYSLEMANDLKVLHGLDIEGELIEVAQYEIAAEINARILDEITRIATWTNAWSYKAAVAPTITADGRFEYEKLRTLVTKITKEANMVGTTTRRGAANWAVVSSMVLTALQQTSNFVYSGNINEILTQGLYMAGTLDGRIKIYVDTYAIGDYCVVGYKGPGNTDAGLIYCPYVPLQIYSAPSRGLYGSTGGKDLGFITRATIASNLYGSSAYYRAFQIDLSGSSLANS